MKIASVADVKAKLSAYLNASADELVVITRNGKAVAVILPIEDEAELERLVIAYSRQFQTLIQQAREELHVGLGIEHDQFWQEVEDAVQDRT
ncbi:type II toxin-antitoxin system Phd/YefM family antitoxin [Candidatus Viridilinea mediisalina]|nr:type II toxin-antitoxin system Phd/YefM family antitoxin [Candidatus Viridilinea mediisalina]